MDTSDIFRVSIAPGWYPDPLDQDAARWWSGETWTDTVQPIPRQAGPPPQPVVPQPVVPPLYPPAQYVPQRPGAQLYGPRSGGPRPAAYASPYAAPGWGPQPRARSGRTGWIVGGVVALGLLILVFAIGAPVLLMRGQQKAVSAAATSYLASLEQGDTAAAYQDWCASDRAQYPQAAFRARHEWKLGHASQVVSSLVDSASNGTTGAVAYRNDDGSAGTLAMEKTADHWEICPRGARLQGDLQNCSCMTPGQRLEADVADTMAARAAEYPWVSVSCPAIPNRTVGTRVACSAADADGRGWGLSVRQIDATHIGVTVVKAPPA